MDMPPGPMVTRSKRPPMMDRVWKKSYFKKSLWDDEFSTDHQLLTTMLKTDKKRTKNIADHLALNPTATITQAPNPMAAPIKRVNDHDPWRIKPINKKIKRTRPAS